MVAIGRQGALIGSVYPVPRKKARSADHGHLGANDPKPHRLCGEFRRRMKNEIISGMAAQLANTDINAHSTGQQIHHAGMRESASRNTRLPWAKRTSAAYAIWRPPITSRR